MEEWVCTPPRAAVRRAARRAYSHPCAPPLVGGCPAPVIPHTHRRVRDRGLGRRGSGGGDGGGGAQPGGSMAVAPPPGARPAAVTSCLRWPRRSSCTPLRPRLMHCPNRAVQWAIAHTGLAPTRLPAGVGSGGWWMGESEPPRDHHVLSPERRAGDVPPGRDPSRPHPSRVWGGATASFPFPWRLARLVRPRYGGAIPDLGARARAAERGGGGGGGGWGVCADQAPL